MSTPVDEGMPVPAPTRDKGPSLGLYRRRVSHMEMERVCEEGTHRALGVMAQGSDLEATSTDESCDPRVPPRHSEVTQRSRQVLEGEPDCKHVDPFVLGGPVPGPASVEPRPRPRGTPRMRSPRA